MKKIIILLFLFLVSCSPRHESVVCTKEFSEPLRTNREIVITYSKNEIIKIDNTDKLYFDDNYTKEDFVKLEADLAEKLNEELNLAYSFEYFNDYVLIVSSLSNIKNASAKELSFVGLDFEDKEFELGLNETIRFNEALGFVCSVSDN